MLPEGSEIWKHGRMAASTSDSQKSFRLKYSPSAKPGQVTTSSAVIDSSGPTNWYQAEMTLSRGSVAIEDAVQIEGPTTPTVGIITGLWHRDGTAAQRVTKQGLFGTRVIVRIEGIHPNWFRTPATLVPAPTGAVPSAEPAQTPSFFPSSQPVLVDKVTDFAQELLRSAQANNGTTTVRTTTTSPAGTMYTETTSTNSISVNATRDGQPIQTYDQKTADGIGPILLAVGADPAAVVEALQQWCGMGPGPAQEYLSTIPAPIPDLHPLNEAFVDDLAAAFRQAGAEVLAPGPDSPLRALARKAASEVNGD